MRHIKKDSNVKLHYPESLKSTPIGGVFSSLENYLNSMYSEDSGFVQTIVEVDGYRRYKGTIWQDNGAFENGGEDIEDIQDTGVYTPNQDALYVQDTSILSEIQLTEELENDIGVGITDVYSNSTGEDGEIRQNTCFVNEIDTGLDITYKTDIISDVFADGNIENSSNDLYENFDNDTVPETVMESTTDIFNTDDYYDEEDYGEEYEDTDYTLGVRKFRVYDVPDTTGKISLAEKIHRISNIDDAYRISFDKLPDYSSRMGYRANFNLLDYGIVDNISEDSENAIRFMLANLPTWYKTKTTRDAIQVVLYTVGLVGDVTTWFTKNYSTNVDDWKHVGLIRDTESGLIVDDLSNIPDDWFATPHFSVWYDITKSTNYGSLSHDRRNNLVRTIMAIKPTNTVFKGMIATLEANSEVNAVITRPFISGRMTTQVVVADVLEWEEDVFPKTQVDFYDSSIVNVGEVNMPISNTFEFEIVNEINTVPVRI